MIKVLSSGIYSSIQDLGRKGYYSSGVPISGVMDEYSARLANLLVNNDVKEAVLEITYGGSKLLFSDDCKIAITGGDFSVKINEKPVELSIILQVEKGSILSFGKRNYGVRTYIAIQGGIRMKSILGSKSFYKGITHKERLEEGDYIYINEQIVNENENKFSRVKQKNNHFKTNTIECFEGPEFNLLNSSQKQIILETLFTITTNSNRMAYFLAEKINNNLPSMLSSGVLPGTIQLTPSGSLIILMKDCQVTGGYPRILQLTDESIGKISQKGFKEKVQFKIKSLT